MLAGLIALYVPLAGAGPSLQRAGIMGLAGLAAMASSRPASRWYALLLAAALTLAWNPRAWGDPGWQLSFAAVAGILLLGVPLGRCWPAPRPSCCRARLAARRAALRLLADGLAITIAATVATAPLLAHHFGTVSTASLPANLLALPAVAPAMWLGMLKAALGQLAAFGPLPGVLAESLGACAALAGRLHRPARRALRRPARRPGRRCRSARARRSASRMGRCAGGARVGARGSPRWHPGRSRTRRAGAAPRAATRLAAPAVAAALVLVTAAALMPAAAPDALTVRFLDVGQGDATLVQHPDRRGGPVRRRAAGGRRSFACCAAPA